MRNKYINNNIMRILRFVVSYNELKITWRTDVRESTRCAARSNLEWRFTYFFFHFFFFYYFFSLFADRQTDEANEIPPWTEQRYASAFIMYLYFIVYTYARPKNMYVIQLAYAVNTLDRNELISFQNMSKGVIRKSFWVMIDVFQTFLCESLHPPNITPIINKTQLSV